jgi:benzoyl-CoA-dihydrodiol lyase
VKLDAATRRATIVVRAPEGAEPSDIDGIVKAGASWWPIRVARELDDAVLSLRTNHLDLGTWIIKTEGNADRVLAVDATLQEHARHWLVRETIGLLRRTLARLEVSSRTLIALAESGACFAGTLLELALAADRTYMLEPDDAAKAPAMVLSQANFGMFPRVDGLSRLESRFYQEEAATSAARGAIGKKLSPKEASSLGLVTATLDEIDWEDEIRIVLEERASMSPDALTGMEANLRFGGKESMEARVFGRLSAWQNWIFIRPNAVGERGALKIFGTGNTAKFNWDRV